MNTNIQRYRLLEAFILMYLLDYCFAAAFTFLAVITDTVATFSIKRIVFYDDVLEAENSNLKTSEDIILIIR